MRHCKHDMGRVYGGCHVARQCKKRIKKRQTAWHVLVDDWESKFKNGMMMIRRDVLCNGTAFFRNEPIIGRVCSLNSDV